MGQSNGGALTDESQLTKVFAIKEKIAESNVILLQHLSSHKQYLLRNATFQQQTEQLQSLVQLNHRQTFNSPYLTNLVKYEPRKDDSLCSKHYRIASLWEYPHRTLAQDINSRALNRQPYSQPQIKALLRQMAEGLAVLQNNRSCHECLTTRAVLVQDRARFRVVDPAAIPVHSNLDLLYQKRGLKNIYLSPEQCRIIDQQDPSRLTSDPFRQDVFVGAMLVLEAGLLQRQDECYEQGCARVNWHKLDDNLNTFEQQYGRPLRSVLEQMLDKQTVNRPDWHQIITLLSSEKIVPEETDNIYRVSVAPPRQQSPQRVTTTRTTVMQMQQPPARSSFTVNYQNPVQLRPMPQTQTVVLRQPLPPPPQPQTLTIHRPVQPARFTYSNIANNNLSNNNNFTVPPNNYQTNHQLSSNINSYAPNISNIPTSTLTSNLFPLTNNNNYQITTTNSSAPTNNYAQMTKPAFNSHLISTDFRINSPTLEHTPILPEKVSLSEQKRVTATFQEQPVRVVQQYQNGASYQGFKLNGKREGWGRYRYQQGGSYEGEWRAGLMCGRGKLFYQSGKVAYDGQLENDLFHGTGILYNEVPEPLPHSFDYSNFEDIDENWISYEGQFRQDKKEGHGVLLLTNGERFQGSFHEDKVQGEGVYRTQQGRQVRGIWHENRFQRQLT